MLGLQHSTPARFTGRVKSTATITGVAIGVLGALGKRLSALDELGKGDIDFDNKAHELRRAIAAHVAEEENLLSELSQHLTSEQNARINSRMWHEGVCLS